MKKAHSCCVCGTDARSVSSIHTSKQSVSIRDLVQVNNNLPEELLLWVCGLCYHKLAIEPQLQHDKKEQKHDGRQHNHGQYKSYLDCEQAVKRNKKSQVKQAIYACGAIREDDHDSFEAVVTDLYKDTKLHQETKSDYTIKILPTISVLRKHFQHVFNIKYILVLLTISLSCTQASNLINISPSLLLYYRAAINTKRFPGPGHHSNIQNEIMKQCYLAG